jgi:enediyne biosynthesis protein E4
MSDCNSSGSCIEKLMPVPLVRWAGSRFIASAVLSLVPILISWLVLPAVVATLGCQQQPAGNVPPKMPAAAKPGDAVPTGSVPTGTVQTGAAPPVDGTNGNEVQKSSEPLIMHDAPDFQLTDQTGKPFGSRELAGRAWVANFMFTKCKATCPRQTEKFEELQRRVARWPDQDRVRLISFTVDPETDSVEHLREYAEAHGADSDRWKFLTGPRADLWTMSRDGFKLPVSASVTDTSSPVTHSPLFVLVDGQQRIRGFFDGLSEEGFRKLLAGLRSVLSAPTSNADDVIHVPLPKDLFDPLWLEQKQAEQLATADKLPVFHDFTFTDRIGPSGIRFVSQAVADAAKDFKKNHYDHANGVSAADVDGDGLTDLYFVNQVGGNELWRNAGGGRFENITDRAGVSLNGRVCVAASFADTDNDGDPDLFVTTTRHGNVLFENLGDGRFADVTEMAGVGYVGHSSTGEFFDYDRDGRLDLLVTNVGVFTTDVVGYSGDRDKKEHPYFIGREEAFIGHLFPDRFERSILYHNEGGNRFRDVSDAAGLVEPIWTGDATPLDANDDGWIDLYFANMQGEDEYYENIAGKRFERRTRSVFPVPVWGGMCVKSFDYNNDGRMDLYVTNMHADMWSPSRTILGAQEKLKTPRHKFPDSYLRSPASTAIILGNGLYEKQESNRFREVSDKVNVENYWPWGHSAGDLNADGFQDLFIASSMNMPFRYQTNSLLLNDRGRTFVDAEFILGVEPRSGGRIATPWFELNGSGSDAHHEAAQGHKGRVVVWAALGSRSSVLFDLDQDGDLDIVTSDFNSPPMVLVSNLAERNADLHFLKIRLQGTRSNRDGLGAKIRVTAGDQVCTQVHDGQSGYLSQSALPLYFGLGTAASIDHISIEWPSGGRQELKGPVAVNRLLVVVEE